jgi:hypothetical protein
MAIINTLKNKLKIMKKVIVRSNGAGVFFGELKELNGDVATLCNVRKLFYWDGAAGVEQLSVDGTSKPEQCKFTVVVEQITVMNVLQILPCTEKSINSLSSVKAWTY